MISDPFFGQGINYDELSKLVNDAYRETRDIRETMKKTGRSFDEVWDMTGMKVWFDFVETDENDETD